MNKLLLTSVAILFASCNSEVSTPPTQTATHDFFEGAWSQAQSQEILDKTMRLNFKFDQTHTTPSEKLAIEELILAGHRFHSLYLYQNHPQGRTAEKAIANLEGRQDLKDIFRIMKGTSATNLENNREKFINVIDGTSAGNTYPLDVTRDGLDTFFTANPDMKDELLHLRSVVKAANPTNIDAAISTLDTYPTLDRLHPGLRGKIKTANTYFALPYSVAYAEDIFFIYDRLNVAAEHLKTEDVAFSRFLKLRARDLLADDYDGGDATWVTASFTGNINAQIGSYETYDDTLFGVKSFFSLSLLQRDVKKSNELAKSIGNIQSIENALPYSAHKQVRNNIPVAVYNVLADFGQARGTNTATILPNEGHLSRQFGRTILIRSNVLTNQEIFAEAEKSFLAATHVKHHNDFKIEGNFYRTLWHEIGHYMGPDQTKSGGDIDAALQNNADLIEEMKADLVSLFSAQKLHADGAYTDEQLRAIYAGGILRTLQKNKPRRTQAYQTMQLIQWNWFLDQGLLTFNNGLLEIHYNKYETAVNSLLKTVLDLQYQGNRDLTDTFVVKWTNWDENLHEVIATKMKAAEGSRYRLVTYEVLGEE